MHKLILFLFLGISVLFSCVKPPSKDPIPILEFQRAENMRELVDQNGNRRDTVVLVFEYSDGDGDIFRDKNADGPNLLYCTQVFSRDSSKFIIDGAYRPATITQPADGYYKGKAIHGEIFLPLSGFRTNRNDSVIRFEAFIVDMKGNKSNVVISPTYTLDF